MARNDQKIEKQGFHHGNLKEAAINLAYERIAEEGTEAINLRRIASECGVDHSALYRHFKNKNALIASVVLRGFRELNANEQQLKQGEAKAFLENYVNFAFTSPNIYKIMFSELGRKFYKDPEIQAEIQKLILISAHTIGNISPKNKISGELRDKVMRTWALVHGFIDLWENRLFKANTPELAKKYILQQVKEHLTELR